MNAGKWDITVYRGMAFSQRFTFTDSSDGSPYNLSSLLPLVAEIRTHSRGPILITLDIDATDASGGIIDVSATHEQTSDLKLSKARWGLRDDAHNYYLDGNVSILNAIPE